MKSVIAFCFIVSSSLWAGEGIHARAGSVAATIHAAYWLGQKIIEKATSKTRPVLKTIQQRVREVRELLLEAQKDPLRNIDQIRDLEDELAELSDPNYKGDLEKDESEVKEDVISTKHVVHGLVPGLWKAMGTPVKPARPSSSESGSNSDGEGRLLLGSSQDDDDDQYPHASKTPVNGNTMSASGRASRTVTPKNNDSQSTPPGTPAAEGSSTVNCWARFSNVRSCLYVGGGSLVVGEQNWLEVFLDEHPYVGKNEIAGLVAAWKKNPTVRGLREIISQTSSVAYLTPEQREAYRTHIVDGMLVQNNRSLAEGSWMFVMGPDGALYVAKHVDGRFHHSSFFAGGSLTWAGEFEIGANGRIEIVSDESGHYQPGAQHNLMGLAILEKLGVNLSLVRFKQEWRPGCGFDGAERTLNAARYFEDLKKLFGAQ